MIYEVYIDGKLLYYPDDLEYAILNSKLDQALNDAGTFEFDIPATNPLYNAIENRRSMVQILKDNEEIFYGEVRETEENLDMTKHVYAAGELAFLYDSIQPQGKYQDQTPIQFFTTLINNHNSQVEEKKQFRAGVVTITDPNDSIYRFTNYEDTLTCIREKLCDSLGGYLRVRKVNGIRYLDLVKLQDYGNTCTQSIEFGENLLKYACNTSGIDIATAVIPLGAKLDESPIVGLDAYTDIKSVNGGKDYVYLEEAVSRFGWIKKVVHWNDVTEPANLKRKAEEWLKENQYELLTLEVDAVDLSMLDSDIDSFNLGDTVNALAAPYGMDAWFPVQKLTIYLQDLTKNYIVLSNAMKKTYTQQINNLTNQIVDDMPQQSAILQQAKDNATGLIQSATNGYIVLNNDDNGNPKELLIMDTKDIATAKKVWRWNINGLGYSNTGYNGEFGLAMTMDGRIVADYITTGTMYADRIKGGILSLGGYDNTSGVAIVRDANGKALITLDVNGITLADGVCISYKNLTDTPDIPDSDYITKITKNTVDTSYVNALGITADWVAAEGITGRLISGKEIRGGIINSANIYFCFDPESDDPLNAFCGGIINRTSGRYGELVIYGNDQITLSTLKSVDDGGYIKFERRTDFEDGITIGNTKSYGGGWADFYYDSNLSGSVFSNYDGFFVESRNDMDLVLNAESGSGTIRYIGQLIQNSSQRYKENVTGISEELAEKTLLLEPVEFDYKKNKKHAFGLIAEKVFKIFPHLVKLDSKGRPDGVSYLELTPLMLKKMQMQEKRILKLEKRVLKLERERRR